MRCGGKSARCETSYAVRSQRVCGGNEPLVHSSACGTYLNHTSNVSRSYSTVTDQHSTALAATFGVVRNSQELLRDPNWTQIFKLALSPDRAADFPQADLIGIGAAVTRRPLPHHRAYGSVHGGSSWLR
jgi:hypothetical protein